MRARSRGRDNYPSSGTTTHPTTTPLYRSYRPIVRRRNHRSRIDQITFNIIDGTGNARAPAPRGVVAQMQRDIVVTTSHTFSPRIVCTPNHRAALCKNERKSEVGERLKLAQPISIPNLWTRAHITVAQLCSSSASCRLWSTRGTTPVHTQVQPLHQPLPPPADDNGYLAARAPPHGDESRRLRTLMMEEIEKSLYAPRERRRTHLVVYSPQPR